MEAFAWLFAFGFDFVPNTKYRFLVLPKANGQSLESKALLVARS
jgi:hypothetical protein